MQEYLTDAVVLDYEPVRDQDGRFALYTEKYGKLMPTGVSVRKITSKLAGHLQPGYLTTVRLIEKKGLRVVDAMKRGTVSASVPDLMRLNRLLHEVEPDRELWAALTAPAEGTPFSWTTILRVLGWDPAYSECAACAGAGGKPVVFHMKNQEFFCATCMEGSATQAGSRYKNELLYI